MSEFFSEDRLFEKDKPQKPQGISDIEAFLEHNAYAISASKLTDQLQHEVFHNVAGIASELYANGPTEVRQFYRAIRHICTEKGQTWEGLLEIHKKNCADGNEDWFKGLLLMAMIGANVTVATVFGKIVQDGTDTENSDWKVVSTDELEADDGDGTGGEDIL